MNVHALLERLIDLPDAEAKTRFVFEQPALLIPENRRRLRDALDSVARDPAEALHALAVLDAIFERCSEERNAYQIGPGPLEQLDARIGRGEISREHALELASEPEIFEHVGLLYASCLAGWMEWNAQQGEWRDSVRAHPLLMRAIEALPDSEERFEMRVVAATVWLDVVARATTDVPDGRLFHPAVEMGEALARIAKKRRHARAESALLHGLGVLHLDPWMTGRNSDGYDQQMRSWRQRLVTEYGRQIDVDPPIPNLELPPPIVALKSAARYLRRAADRRSGRQRGQSLKAYAEALQWRKFAGGWVRKGKIVAAARKALADLDPDLDLSHVRTLETILAYNAAEWELDGGGQSIDTDSIDRVLERHDPIQAVAHLANAADRTADPERRLRLWTEARDLSREYSSDQDRVSLLQRGVLWVGSSLADPMESDSDTNFLALAIAVEKIAFAQQWDAARLAANYFEIARRAAAVEHEEEGLEVLSRVFVTDPNFLTRYADEMLFLQATLLRNSAVNDLNSDALGSAIQKYMLASSCLLELDLVNAALELIRNKVADLVTAASPEDVHQLTLTIASITLELQAIAGEAGAEIVHELLQACLSRMAETNSFNPDSFGRLRQTMKGAAFSAGLGIGSDLALCEDDKLRELSVEIRRATAALPDDDRTGEATRLDMSWQLMAYVRPEEASSGSTPRGRLANLERSFDARVNRLLLDRNRDCGDYILSDGELRASLDSRTVVLDLLLGRSDLGTAAVYAVLHTRDESIFRMARHEDLPTAVIELEDGGQTLHVHWYSLPIAGLRDAILMDPEEGRVVHSAANDSLKMLSDTIFFGDIPEILEGLRDQGKDCLCIVPDGPFNFAPIHLAECGGRMIAQDWIVTYAPSVRLLSRGSLPVGSSTRSSELAVFAHSFSKGEHGQPALPDARAEAESIASIYGAAVITDDDADKGALATAFADSRNVHLATHGAHCVHAPAFQTLFLAPDDESGVLEAWELFDWDLSGVDLVSLSACETALGRFDAYGNSRGIPAALLTKGVSTIVGALWDAETESSTFFFTEFYGAIRGGSDRRDAFRLAQAKTRARFPELRDWAAFQYIGSP